MKKQEIWKGQEKKKKMVSQQKPKKKNLMRDVINMEEEDWIKKQKKFKKNEICLIKDFQEFGEILFLLNKRMLKNVFGEKLSNPIWEGYIVDAKNENLRTIWHNKFFYGAEVWEYPALSYEKDLIKLEVCSLT